MIIQTLAPLHTSLAFACAAQTLYRVESLADCAAVPAGPHRLLGGGSNVLCAASQLASVVQIAIRGIALVAESKDAYTVEVGAGEPWHAVVLHTLLQGWAGLENLALIPGWAGAAPVQNIGAYGLELSERLESVQAWDTVAREHVTIGHADCQFGYRDSLFKREAGRYWITGIRLTLPKPWRPVLRYADLAQLQSPSPQAVCDAVIRIRQTKLPDPAVIPNAGSFFKNPVIDADLAIVLKDKHPNLPCYPQPDGRVKIAAGWLIEQAGWKGYRAPQSPVGVHANQALVLVHDTERGAALKIQAKGADLLHLATQIQASVREQFQVELEREVNLWT